MLKIGTAEFPLNGKYTLNADITLPPPAQASSFASGYVLAAALSEGESEGWTPIAGDFRGIFDGNGKTITITNGSGGLFYSLKGAYVKNLTIRVTATVTSDNAALAGGIARYAEYATIENCQAVVDFDVTGHNHNSSAGGIVGTMIKSTKIRNCTASGRIELKTGKNEGLMIYAGGIAGYSGTAENGSGASGCVISGSRWTAGTVSAQGGYPYAGGVVGYNYAGAKVTECSAAGTVTATGENLPYSGGIAGYNSRRTKSKSPSGSLIENCRSDAVVKAVSTSKAALAGGIAGANAAGAEIRGCSAYGAVSATVNGSSTDDIGGTLGVLPAANAGGIAGAQYVNDVQDGNNGPPVIANCHAVNPSITGTDTGTGASWNIYRIAGAGSGSDDTGVYENNTANSKMTLTPPRSPVNEPNGKDGADK